MGFDGDTATRRMAALWGASRIGLGIFALLWPRALASVWVGPAAARGPAGTVLGRALGGRDVALGAGTLLSAQNGRALAPWVLASGGADAVDAVATVLARTDLPRGRRRLVLAASAGSALVAGVLTAALRGGR